MKIIKLIYDRYENDIGFAEGNYEDHEHEIIKKINDKKISNDRKINITTWGVKKHLPHDCQIIFDATLFTTKIDGDIKNLTGLDEKIQKSVINHPKFDIIIENILINIETYNYENIGIICNYGKHRSVAWAELLKKLYYPKSNIKHIGI